MPKTVVPAETRCFCRCVYEDHQFDPETGETPCKGCDECDNFNEYDHGDDDLDGDRWYSAWKNGDFD